jgi:cytochrome c553
MKLKLHFNRIILASIILLPVFTASATDMSFGKLKSDACSGCHGIKGISPFPLRPSLAGQDADYLVHQLKAFKSGLRKNDIMKGISESLTDNEMIALASYYSGQSAEVTISGDALLIKKGREKYSLCWSCHGENGEGPGSYPSVAGQHPQYTIQQLKNFKDGSRKNPVMKALVGALSDNDMEALGAYIATLKP